VYAKLDTLYKTDNALNFVEMELLLPNLVMMEIGIMEMVAITSAKSKKILHAIQSQMVQL